EFVACGVPFEHRVGRMLEGLRLMRALWRGEPVDWSGRWVVDKGVVGPTPHRPGGPPIWIGGMVKAAIERTGKFFDGWFPNGPEAPRWGEQWREVQHHASEAGRDPAQLVGAIYLTLTIDDDAARADQRMNAYLENYYGRPAAEMRNRQATYAGPAAGAAEWLAGYANAGASHIMLRFAGDHQRHLEEGAKMRQLLGW
ncbi:MAG: LLM class flavin-dependent oxidoreductase, partial [Stellaceae bacterium]